MQAIFINSLSQPIQPQPIIMVSIKGSIMVSIKASIMVNIMVSIKVSIMMTIKVIMKVSIIVSIKGIIMMIIKGCIMVSIKVNIATLNLSEKPIQSSDRMALFSEWNHPPPTRHPPSHPPIKLHKFETYLENLYILHKHLFCALYSFSMKKIELPT